MELVQKTDFMDRIESRLYNLKGIKNYENYS